MCNAGIAGLAVTYGLNLNMYQSWVVWNLCFMENRIISVERILQYTSLSSEPPLVIESNRPASCWPTQGEVNIQDLQVIFSVNLSIVEDNNTSVICADLEIFFKKFYFRFDTVLTCHLCCEV